MKNKIIILLIILFCPIPFYAQVHNIFLDDTMYYSRSKYFYTVALNNNLSDGMWILHNLYRKDSNKICNRTIMLTGNYKNYQKEGTFNTYQYYYSLNYKKKWKKNESELFYIDETATYKSGLLNGMLISRDARYNLHILECMYEQGKRNGLQVCYCLNDKNLRNLCCINCYHYDTLIYCIQYRSKNKILYSLNRTENKEYIYTIYDILGQRQCVLFFDTTFVLYKYQEYYENQILKKEAEGLFLNNITSLIFEEAMCLFYCKCEVENNFKYEVSLTKGVEKTYNKQGELIEKRNVENVKYFWDNVQ